MARPAQSGLRLEHAGGQRGPVQPGLGVGQRELRVQALELQGRVGPGGVRAGLQAQAQSLRAQQLRAGLHRLAGVGGRQGPLHRAHAEQGHAQCPVHHGSHAGVMPLQLRVAQAGTGQLDPPWRRRGRRRGRRLAGHCRARAVRRAWRAVRRGGGGRGGGGRRGGGRGGCRGGCATGRRAEFGAVEPRLQALDAELAQAQAVLQRQHRDQVQARRAHLGQRLARALQPEVLDVHMAGNLRPGRGVQGPLHVQRGVQASLGQAHRQVLGLQRGPLRKRQLVQLQVDVQQGAGTEDLAAQAQAERRAVEQAPGAGMQRAVGAAQGRQLGELELQLAQVRAQSAGLVFIAQAAVAEIEGIDGEARCAARGCGGTAGHAPQDVLEVQVPVGVAHDAKLQALQAHLAEARVQSPQRAPVQAHTALGEAQRIGVTRRVEYLQVLHAQAQQDGVEAQRAYADHAAQMLLSQAGDLPAQQRGHGPGGQGQQQHEQQREYGQGAQRPAQRNTGVGGHDAPIMNKTRKKLMGSAQDPRVHSGRALARPAGHSWRTSSSARRWA